MKNIKILATGSPKCKATKNIEEVIKENNIDATAVKVEDIMEITNINVQLT